METYFDTLPQELINEILVRLENNDLTELEELFKINYEILMMLKYSDFYRKIKNIFKVDKSLRKYNQSWKLVYLEMIKVGPLLKLTKEKYYNYEVIYDINSTLIDLVYSIILKSEFEELYHLRSKSDSPYFSLLLCECFKHSLSLEGENEWLGLQTFLKTGKLLEKLTYQNYKGNMDISYEDELILLFLLCDDPNFEIAVHDFDDFCDGFYERIRNDDSVDELVNIRIRLSSHLEDKIKQKTLRDSLPRELPGIDFLKINLPGFQLLLDT